MKYLIGISGPPRAGKDTLGQAIAAQLAARTGKQPALVALSMPMRQAVYAMLGIPYDPGHYEREKDIHRAAFGGGTIREAMIALSEEHVIPRYGDDFWAQAGIEMGEATGADVMVVTDMGFGREVDVMERYFGFNRCMWPQLKRPGHDFSRDSRGYVGREERVVTLDNPGMGLDFFIAAARRVVDVADHWGWSLS